MGRCSCDLRPTHGHAPGQCRNEVLNDGLCATCDDFKRRQLPVGWVWTVRNVVASQYGARDSRWEPTRPDVTGSTVEDVMVQAYAEAGVAMPTEGTIWAAYTGFWNWSVVRPGERVTAQPGRPIFPDHWAVVFWWPGKRERLTIHASEAEARRAIEEEVHPPNNRGSLRRDETMRDEYRHGEGR